MAPLLGKPLIAYAIESALAAVSITDVVVSTDCPKIAATAKLWGAMVPFMRPASLAGDDTPDGPVMRHALETMAKMSGRVYDAVAILRPTAPLRTSGDIDGAVAAHAAARLPVRSVSLVSQHPYWMKIIGPDGLLKPLIPEMDEVSHPRRQTLPPVYRLNGVIDVVPADLNAMAANTMFMGPLVPFLISRERSVDIDTPADLARAETFLNEYGESL